MRLRAVTSSRALPATKAQLEKNMRTSTQRWVPASALHLCLRSKLNLLQCRVATWQCWACLACYRRARCRVCHLYMLRCILHGRHACIVPSGYLACIVLCRCAYG